MKPENYNISMIDEDSISDEEDEVCIFLERKLRSIDEEIMEMQSATIQYDDKEVILRNKLKVIKRDWHLKIN